MTEGSSNKLEDHIELGGDLWNVNGAVGNRSVSHMDILGVEFSVLNQRMSESCLVKIFIFPFWQVFFGLKILENFFHIYLPPDLYDSFLFQKLRILLLFLTYITATQLVVIHLFTRLTL